MRLPSDNGLDDYYKESPLRGLSLRVPLSFCENRTIFSSLFIGLSVFSSFNKGKTILYSCKLSSPCSAPVDIILCWVRVMG